LEVPYERDIKNLWDQPRDESQIVFKSDIQKPILCDNINDLIGADDNSFCFEDILAKKDTDFESSAKGYTSLSEVDFKEYSKKESDEKGIDYPVGGKIIFRVVRVDRVTKKETLLTKHRKMISKCPHTKDSYYANGMCKNCYHKNGRKKNA
jgi:hypothetical protein